MRPVGILVTGDPVQPVAVSRGGFADLIRDVIAEAGLGFCVYDARRDELPELDALSAVVVTGSAASVTERAAWMLKAGAALAGAVERERPVLGICFGHQLLGEALGGRVEKNPLGREMGTVSVEILADDAVLPETSPFSANASHVDSVVQLPPGARVLARTALEPHAAVRFGKRAWGVQFHPEFDAEVMRGYIHARSQILREEGADPGALLAGAADADPGREVLLRFARYVAELEAQGG